MTDKGDGKVEKFEEEFFSVFDKEHGGFGEGEKFPPFASLLFMMSLYDENGSERLREMITLTLNKMASGGLKNGAGGFYRYSSERTWGSPNEGKTLFDQGMHLWVFSVAYKLFGMDLYKETVHGLVAFLKEQYLDDHLFKVGVDGADEDRKVTSWNAIVGIGLAMAGRYCGHGEALGIAERIFAKLMTEHLKGGKLVHSTLRGEAHGEEALEDYASVLLLATFLFENSFDGKDLLETLAVKVASLTAKGDTEVYNVSSPFDVPVPSAVSVAEFALLRVGKILEKSEYCKPDFGYGAVLESDFHNLCVFLAGGALHDIHVKERIDWEKLPVNVLQMPGTMYLDCYGNMCKMYKSEEELVSALKKG